MIQRANHTMRAALLVAGLLVPPLAVGQQPAPGPAASDYESLVRRAVEDELRKSGKSPSDFRIEIIGEPNNLAGHSLLHRRVTEPPAGRALLSGRVVDSNWEIAAGVRIFLTSPRDAGVPPSTVTTNSGEFQFPDVAPGDYLLRFEGKSHVTRVSLEEGRKRILVPLGGSSDSYSIFDAGDRHSPMVVARVYRGDKLEMFHQVDLSTSPLDVQTVDVNELASDGEFGAGSFPTAPELKQLNAELAPFLAALLDVTRGPERLKPFLSSRIVCRAYYSGERLIPSIDDERCGLNLLDSIALSMWFQVEGAGEYPGRLVLDWYDEPRGVTDEQLLAVARRRHEILRSELRDAGMFEPEHAARVQRYFREALAAAPILKVNVSQPMPEFPLPEGELYLLPVPLFLIREGQELHVIGTMLGGG